MDDRDVLSKNDRRTSSVWQYFEVLDVKNKAAICTKCNQVLSYRGTVSNLRKHYKNKHEKGIMSKDSENEDISMEEKNSIHEDTSETSAEPKTNESNYGNRNRKSAAWKYFTIFDEDKFIASCNLCSGKFSYNSSVSNLMKHIRRKHGLPGIDGDSTTDDECNEDPGSDAGEKPGRSRAMVWIYFKCIDPVLKLCMCLICKKRYSYVSISNLKRHLLRKHPKVKLPEKDGDTQMIISADGQLYEIETNDATDNVEDSQNEAIEMDTVYLEDYIDDDVVEIKPSNERKKVKTSKIIDKNNSSDEEVSRNKYAKKEDSLDYFAKYVTSLLRQLPKNISDQLQMDFIKEIMNAKITLSRPVVVVPSNSYSISVTDQEATEKSRDTKNVAEDNK